MRIVIVIGLIAFADVLAYWMLLLGDQDPRKVSAVTIPYGALAVVLLPKTLPQKAQISKQAFAVSCLSCHGENAAVTVGVRAHHWPFGIMSAVEGVARGNIKMVTAYIREL